MWLVKRGSSYSTCWIWETTSACDGHMFRTKTGELSVWVEELFFLGKALLPLPEKWHGLSGHRAALPATLSGPGGDGKVSGSVSNAGANYPGDAAVLRQPRLH